jgi:hypothetical protein
MASHRVTRNPFDSSHTASRHSQLPKLDVGSIPIVTDPGRDAGRLEPRRPRLNHLPTGWSFGEGQEEIVRAGTCVDVLLRV